MIQLHGHYRSISASIPEGIYEDSDPVLQGLANYLVNSGHASRLDLPAIELDPAKNETESVVNPTLESTEAAPVPKSRRGK